MQLEGTFTRSAPRLLYWCFHEWSDGLPLWIMGQHSLLPIHKGCSAKGSIEVSLRSVWRTGTALVMAAMQIHLSVRNLPEQKGSFGMHPVSPLDCAALNQVPDLRENMSWTSCLTSGRRKETQRAGTQTQSMDRWRSLQVDAGGLLCCQSVTSPRYPSVWIPVWVLGPSGQRNRCTWTLMQVSLPFNTLTGLSGYLH